MPDRIIHCMKCKKKTSTKNLVDKVAKNGRKMVQGVCTVCETRKSMFVKG